MMDFGRRWLDKGKDKDKDKEKEKEKGKDKEKAHEAKQREKEQRKEEKERVKERKKSENGNHKLGEVDWKGARGNLRRRSTSYTNEDKKTVSPRTRAVTYGRNSISLLDLHAQKGPVKSPSSKGGVIDARTAKQKQKEKAFLESIAQQNVKQDKPSVFAIASESYKLRILELEDEVTIANKRVTSLTDRVHMLEAEIRAANDHHTRHNANLQEKLANVETDNAVLKNNFAKLTVEKEALEIHLGELDDGVKTRENGEVQTKITTSASSPAKISTLAPPVPKSSSLSAVDKNAESLLRQRIQVLEAELSAKTNDLAVLKLQTNTLEPQVKSLAQDLAKSQQGASDNEEMVTNVVEILGEWQTATEGNDAELRDYLADESEVTPDEEVRRFNKKVLLLRERVSGADQTIYRIAKAVGVNSVRLDLGPLKGDAAGKESNQSHANTTRNVRSNSLSERDAALSIKLAVITTGIEPAVQKLVKGIFLNTVRSVNLGGGLALSTEIIQSLSKALLVSTTVLSVLFPNTFLGDSGASLVAAAMLGNSSITNLNMEECGISDTGIKELAQALAGNRKAALASLNLSRNSIGVSGAQSLAEFLGKSNTLTKLDLGYSHLGAESVSFIAQTLKNAQNPLSTLLVPGNDFGDEGASKFASSLSTNTKLRVLNIQGNGITKLGITELAKAIAQCRIVTLDVSRNPIGPDGALSVAESLKKNSSLKDLSLISCGILSQGAIHLADCLEHNTTLSTLHLWGNKFGSAGLAAFSGDKKLGNIKTLDLRGNEIVSSSGKELSSLLSKKSSLLSLDLTGNALGPKGCELISKALSSSHLSSLYLSANSLGNDGVQHVARSLSPSITTLSLSLNFLGDDAMDYLAPSLCLSHITHLDLSWNHIGAGGAREISKILEKDNCPITILNLEGNSLGPEGAVHLAASLHSNVTLCHLILAANNFRKDGTKAIAEMLKRSPTITNLNIAKNGIKDDGARALSDALKTNNTLAHLDLSENRIENQGIHSLSEALKLNSSLLSISLSHNPFDRSGVLSLAQAHVRNPKVHVAIHTM